MAVHFYPLTVRDIRRETPDCVSVAFDIPENLADTFKFIPGQNITLRKILRNEEIRRSYSICSTPNEGELRVAIKKVEGGLFSGYANHELKPGDIIEVLPPTGRFYTPLNPANKKTYVAFAAGSGITPLLSIIRTTLETEQESTFILIFGNRNRNSIIFREELEGIKNRYMSRFILYHTLSQEKTDTPLHSGRIDREKCNLLFDHLIGLHSVDEFFLCGPEEMIFTVKAFLEEKQVPQNKIHFELFTTPGRKTSNGEQQSLTDSSATSSVTVKLDGTAISFDLPYGSQSILDAALEKGADLPYACKGGVCCTCKAKLISGEVEMEVNYGLEQDEIDAGFILTCQAHPRSGNVVVDFDQRT